MDKPHLVSDKTPRWLRQCTGTDYRLPVPTAKRIRPQRTVAVAQDDWDDLAVAAERAGYERAMLIRALIRWYLRRPGAKLPQRPGD